MRCQLGLSLCNGKGSFNIDEIFLDIGMRFNVINKHLIECIRIERFRVLLEYPTTTGFQWGLLKNDRKYS